MDNAMSSVLIFLRDYSGFRGINGKITSRLGDYGNLPVSPCIASRFWWPNGRATGKNRKNSRFDGKNSESAVAQFWVERVAQCVAEEAEAEDGERNRKTWKDRDPWRGRRVFLGAALQHQPPGRGRLLHAEAEIGERSFGEDRLADKGG